MKQGWGIQEISTSFKKAMSVWNAGSYSRYCYFDELSSLLYTERPNSIEKKLRGRKKCD